MVLCPKSDITSLPSVKKPKRRYLCLKLFPILQDSAMAKSTIFVSVFGKMNKKINKEIVAGVRL